MSARPPRPRPQTALITAAIRRKEGWKACTLCHEPKAPGEFRKWRTVCIVCDNRVVAERKRKGNQAIVKVPISGWGYRGSET